MLFERWSKTFLGPESEKMALGTNMRYQHFTDLRLATRALG